MTERVRILDASIRIDTMPAEGRELRLAVGEEERAEIAAHLGLQSVDKLEVTLHADKFRGGVRVRGAMTATIVQPSVVSLEPVTQQIEETVDRVFLPGGEKPFASTAGAEIFVDLDGEDVPDHFEGPEADLSDLVVETLSLAIDPYPRLAGESLEDIGIAGDDPRETSPFAGLKALKPAGGKDR